MDLAGLRVVKAVADTGSVSRAAEALNCVQSNVTARIKRLEEDLGVDLFLRLSRGMEPTPAGRVLTAMPTGCCGWSPRPATRWRKRPGAAAGWRWAAWNRPPRCACRRSWPASTATIPTWS